MPDNGKYMHPRLSRKQVVPEVHPGLVYDRAQVITSAVEGASDNQMKWKLKSPAMNSMEFVPATSLHSCQHCSSLIARLLGIIIIPAPVKCNAFMSRLTQILYHKSWNICISYISQYQPSYVECVHPNDISRMIPRMGASVPPLVLMCLIPTNIGLATWHPPFDVHRPPFVQHRPPVCTLFVHRSTGTCRTTSYSSAVLNLVSVVDLDPIHSQLQLTFQKIHKWTFLATLVALHFTPVSERVSDS